MRDYNNDFNVDDLLNRLFKPSEPQQKESLKELFNRRVQELGISPTNVLTMLNLASRTLNGILNGTQKMVDYTNLIKIAHFLQLPKEQILQLYIDEIEKNFPLDITSTPQRIEFINENFDLVSLKKAGFIKSISDYNQIENRITSFFGLKDIFEYKRPPFDVAYSSGVIRPKNDLGRSVWVKTASDVLNELNNPFDYERKNLIDYFPQIRWHSTNVELGLTNVIRQLFKIGITVIYQPSLSSLHLRGATFSHNNKPSIVITDYKGFYPTLWFALIHELFHVLFDWDEIKNNSYHISDDGTEELSVIEKEKEANLFAREYLFSKQKMSDVKPHLYDVDYVKEFANNNHVHHSFVYVFNAYDLKNDRTAWAKAKKQNPTSSMTNLLTPLENRWDNPKPIKEFVNSMKYRFYN
jgi:HTH-type transcriptional regulator / antitoxin HigA